LYTYENKENLYFILKNGEQLKTPGGQDVKTKIESIAKRLVQDLLKYGEDPSRPDSVVSMHYSSLDFGLRMSKEEAIADIQRSLLAPFDWTSSCPSANPNEWMRWKSFFGDWEERREQIKAWLQTLSMMKRSAVACVGNSFETLNIPYIIGSTLDKEGLHEDFDNYLKEINDLIEHYYDFPSGSDFQILKTFAFYYNAANKPVG